MYIQLSCTDSNKQYIRRSHTYGNSYESLSTIWFKENYSNDHSSSLRLYEFTLLIATRTLKMLFEEDLDTEFYQILNLVGTTKWKQIFNYISYF